jgi:prepilin-type processing-associated H-X9-DG protein
VGWQAGIQPYVKNGQIFLCPSNNLTDYASRPSGAFARYVQGAGPGNAYGYPVMYPKYACNMNDTFASSSPTSDRFYSTKTGFGIFGSRGSAGVRLATIQYPSQVIAVFENCKNYPDITIDEPVAGVGSPDDPVNNNKNDQVFVGHMGTGNFLFADGHVKAMKPLATILPTNMWRRDNAVPTTGIDLTSYNNIMTNLRAAEVRANAQ